MADVVIFTECNGSIGWGRDAGAYTVASRLREVGYNVKVIDFFSHFNISMFKAAIDNFVTKDTLFLGFSSTHFSTLKPDEWEQHWQSDSRTRKNNMWNVYFPFEPDELNEWFNYAKQKYPQLKIIVGGQKVAQKQSLQKRYPFVDIWVGGMADKAVVGIANSLKNKEILPNKIKSELDYGNIEENIFNTSKIHWAVDDHIFAGEALPLEISRGCPFECAFCDYTKKKTNTWTVKADNLRQQLLYNYYMFNVTHYMLTDFQINENIDKLKMIHKVFTNLPFKITWSGFGRLDLIRAKPEMVDLIQESGCRSIQWGIETINDKVGPLVGKVTKRDVIEISLEKCKTKWKDDIVMGSGFILGLPGETLESCKELVEWTEHQPWLNAWEITPLYIGTYNKDKEYTIDYSKIQKNPEKYGYKISMELNNNGVYIEDWSNKNMTKSALIEMIEETQKSDAWQRRIMTSYLGYSRCSNLGFNHRELLSANKNNKTWIRQHADNYKSLANIYLQKNGLV